MDKALKEDLIEIRWHGRGGQGVKTASEMFAGLVFEMGEFVQSFPEFGPERSGAPMTAFNRISNKAVRRNHNIYEPDVLVVADKTLLNLKIVLKGLKKNGKILINSSLEEFEGSNEMKVLENYSKNLEIYLIDANKISSEELGHIYPNIPLMSALSKMLNLDEAKFLKFGEEEIKKSFSQKKELISGNINTMQRAVNEVIKYR